MNILITLETNDCFFSMTVRLYVLQFDDAYATPLRYRVPMDIVLPSTGADNPLYEFQITDRFKLSFQIVRKATGTVM